MWEILVITIDPDKKFPEIVQEFYFAKLSALNLIEQKLKIKMEEGYTVRELIDKQLQFIAHKDNIKIYYKIIEVKI